MDVVRVALALFLLAPLAAAAPVEIPAVKEFHETMMMNPDNRTAMVADGEVSKEEDVVPNASPNVADGVKTGIGFGIGIVIAFIIIAICLSLFCMICAFICVVEVEVKTKAKEESPGARMQVHLPDITLNFTPE